MLNLWHKNSDNKNIFQLLIKKNKKRWRQKKLRRQNGLIASIFVASCRFKIEISLSKMAQGYL